MVGRVWPRHGHRGRPLNSVDRRHQAASANTDVMHQRGEPVIIRKNQLKDYQGTESRAERYGAFQLLRYSEIGLTTLWLAKADSVRG
jgi:hypothetical protein